MLSCSFHYFIYSYNLDYWLWLQLHCSSASGLFQFTFWKYEIPQHKCVTEVPNWKSHWVSYLCFAGRTHSNPICNQHDEATQHIWQYTSGQITAWPWCKFHIQLRVSTSTHIWMAVSCNISNQCTNVHDNTTKRYFDWKLIMVLYKHLWECHGSSMLPLSN